MAAGISGLLSETTIIPGQVCGEPGQAPFTANAAWTVLAAIAYNLTRAAGAAASTLHARARTATIRRHLITLPGRVARSARRLRLHPPTGWPWHDAFTQLFTTACGPPHPATT